MNKVLIKSPEEFEKWKQKEIKNFPFGHNSRIARKYLDLDSNPKQFPFVITYFWDFDDDYSHGFSLAFEIVYQDDFEKI